MTILKFIITTLIVITLIFLIFMSITLSSYLRNVKYKNKVKGKGSKYE